VQTLSGQVNGRARCFGDWRRLGGQRGFHLQRSLSTPRKRTEHGPATTTGANTLALLLWAVGDNDRLAKLTRSDTVVIYVESDYTEHQVQEETADATAHAESIYHSVRSEQTPVL
jgi:hypothetical protein